MEDSKIIALFYARSEQAIAELSKKGVDGIPKCVLKKLNALDSYASIAYYE